MSFKLQRSGGFTLIELLVAIALLAIVSVLSWRGLDGIFRSRDALGDEVVFNRSLQSTFNQLNADLRSAARDTLVNFNAANTSKLPGLQFNNGVLTLLRYRFASDGSAGDVGSAGNWQVVRYRLVNNTVQRQLVAVAQPAQVRAFFDNEEAWKALSGSGFEQTLLEKVRSLSWRVANKDGFSDAAAQQAALAQALNGVAAETRLAVELTLELESGERFVRQWLVRE